MTETNTYTGNTVINAGALQVDGSITSDTFVNRGGTLAGGGTISGDVTNNRKGTVSPGGPLGVPGALTIGNNYTQMRSAILLIQIGGADASEVSLLNVQGIANLNGSLDPKLVNGFVPDVGQSFEFMNYASVTGSFSHIVNRVFDHGRKRWAVAYHPSRRSIGGRKWALIRLSIFYFGHRDCSVCDAFYDSHYPTVVVSANDHGRAAVSESYSTPKVVQVNSSRCLPDFPHVPFRPP